jgi:hypothetical protein
MGGQGSRVFSTGTCWFRDFLVISGLCAPWVPAPGDVGEGGFPLPGRDFFYACRPLLKGQLGACSPPLCRVCALVALYFCKSLFHGLELMTSWSQGNNFTVALGLPFQANLFFFVINIFPRKLVILVPSGNYSWLACTFLSASHHNSRIEQFVFLIVRSV